MALTYHRARWPKVTPTHQQYCIVARQRTSIGFKLAVRGNFGAGGLVAMGCHLSQKFVGMTYLYE